MPSPSGWGSPASGAAGALIVTIADPMPALGPAYTLLAFIIVIIGGMGSMAGALVGGILIGVSEALAGFLFAPSMKSMFSFALLIAVLVLRPQGLMGRRAMTVLWRDLTARGRVALALALACSPGPAVDGRPLPDLGRHARSSISPMWARPGT